MFSLLQKGKRASQYFRRTVSRAQTESSFGKIRAVPENSGPVIFPRMVHGANRTAGLLRMRLHLPESGRVMTKSLPFCSPNQIGVRTSAPVLRKVARLAYFCP